MSTAIEIERSPVRLFGVAVICAKVALVPLVFHQAFDSPFTVPKALLSHSLAYLLGAAGLPLEAIAALDEALAIAPNERTASQLRSEIRARLQ